MKNIFLIIENAYSWIIAGIFMGIITLLCLFDATSTSHLINWEHTVYVRDSIFLHLITIACLMIIILYLKKSKINQLLIVKLLEEIEFKRWKKCIIGCIFALSSLWALSTQFVPGIDEYAIQNSVREVMQGNFESFTHMAYMDQYPNQWGFFLFSYFLASIFGEMNYLIVELLIAFAISMVFKQLSEIAEMLGAGKIEQLIVLTVGIIYFPFLLYSTMVYGNIFGIAFALTAIKYEFIFFKFGKKKDAIKCSVAIALGVLMKSNMQIYFLAILFSSAINLIKKWKEAIFLIIAICLTYYIQATGVAILIKLMTGCQLDCPITSFAWIAMGLQNGDLAPGWWNSYTINSYYECGGDVKLHTAMCKQSIESSLAAFFNDPSSATDFFTKKILSTWTNPTFQCFGTVRNGSYIITPKWIQYLLSYPGQYSVSKYLNSFCFLIYFGGFLYIISRNFNDLDELILPMIFIGGFVFYLFWETKSRYALMFFVVLIPCAIRGYVQAIKSLENISINNLKKALLSKKLRILCVILVMGGFYMIYSNKFNYLLKQDTTVYKEYVENSSKQEVTEYIEKQQ